MILLFTTFQGRGHQKPDLEMLFSSKLISFLFFYLFHNIVHKGGVTLIPVITTFRLLQESYGRFLFSEIRTILVILKQLMCIRTADTFTPAVFSSSSPTSSQIHKQTDLLSLSILACVSPVESRVCLKRSPWLQNLLVASLSRHGLLFVEPCETVTAAQQSCRIS